MHITSLSNHAVIHPVTLVSWLNIHPTPNQPFPSTKATVLYTGTKQHDPSPAQQKHDPHDLTNSPALSSYPFRFSLLALAYLRRWRCKASWYPPAWIEQAIVAR